MTAKSRVQRLEQKLAGATEVRQLRCAVCGGAFDADPEPTDSGICGTLGIGDSDQPVFGKLRALAAAAE